jgi:hypothetical protein
MRTPKAARGIVILLGVALMTASAQAQVVPIKSEIASGKRWLREHLLAPKAQPPFSFVDGGQKSETLLRGALHAPGGGRRRSGQCRAVTRSGMDASVSAGGTRGSNPCSLASGRSVPKSGLLASHRGSSGARMASDMGGA